MPTGGEQRDVRHERRLSAASISRGPTGPYGCAQAECQRRSRSGRHLTCKPAVAPIRHCANGGGAAPTRRTPLFGLTGLRLRRGRPPRGPLGGFRKKRDEVSAGALSEIRNEGWTVDMRRRKPTNLLIYDTPIRAKSLPIKSVEAYAASAFRCEACANYKAI
jgi:hypothetical protein